MFTLEHKKYPFKLKQRLVTVFLIIIFAYLVVPPVLFMIWTSITPDKEFEMIGTVSMKAFVDIWTSDKFIRSVVNTLHFAVGSTIVGVALGTLMAWLVARTDTPGKRIAYLVTFMGFAVPGMIKIIGWVFLLGPQNGIINKFLNDWLGQWAIMNIQSMGGMIFVESLFWVPMVFLLMVGPMRSMDPSLEESAAVAGASPFRRFRKITFHLMLPSVLAVLILMFIRSIQAFEIPLFLGTPGGVSILSSDLFRDLHDSYLPDYAKAAAYGTMLLSFLVIILFIYYQLTKKANRFQTVTGKGFRPRLIKLGKCRWLGTAYLLIMFVIYVLPIATICLVSFAPTSGGLSKQFWSTATLVNYKELLHYPGIVSSVLNSFVVGLVTAFIVVILVFAASWIIVRSKLRGIWALDQLIAFPLIIPGIVFGLSVLLFYLYVPIPFYGTIWIMVAAYVANYSPYAIRFIQPALLQIHPELEESAKVSGANWMTVFSRILAPLMMPSIVGAWFYVFFYSIRELSIAALLYTGSTSVISTQIMDMWANGGLTTLSAFGTIVTVFSIGIATIAFSYVRKFGVKV